MKNTKVGLCTGLLLVLFCACRQNKNAVMQVKDNEILLQAKPIPTDQAETNTVDYAVHLIPDKKLLTGKDGNFKNSLWYSMDSCFYLMNGRQKIYSAIVQPIANGVSGTFEYMLSFNENDLKAGKWSLIYDDRYLNHKKYILDLH